jgi:hypothetical protein
VKHIKFMAKQRPVLAQEEEDPIVDFLDWYNFIIDVAMYIVSAFGPKFL